MWPRRLPVDTESHLDVINTMEAERLSKPIEIVPHAPH